jgi:hypothetical protein
LRGVPAVPLVYINPRSVVILEPASEKTMAERQKIESSKLHAPPPDMHPIASAQQRGLSAAASPSKQKAKDESESMTTITALTSNPRTRSLPATAEAIIGKRKRGGGMTNKAPNPLSVKKKKPRIPPPPPKRGQPTGERAKTDNVTGADATMDEATKRKRRRRSKGTGMETGSEMKASTVGVRQVNGL